jgi:Flp pilus assembly protein TadD
VIAAALLLAVPLGGETHARNVEFRSSLDMAGTLLERWPTGGAHYMYGWELASRGRHSQALLEYESASATFPRARYYLGSELLDAGRAREAADQLREFLELEPELLEAVPAQHKLAEALVVLHEYAEALSHYEAYLAVRPDDVEAVTAYGIALSDSDHDRDAIAAFRRAAALAPRDARIRANLARALFLVEELQAAETEARASLALDGRDRQTHDLLGRMLAHEGRLEDAVREFDEALAIDASDSEAQDAKEAIERLRRQRGPDPRARRPAPPTIGR